MEHPEKCFGNWSKLTKLFLGRMTGFTTSYPNWVTDLKSQFRATYHGQPSLRNLKIFTGNLKMNELSLEIDQKMLIEFKKLFSTVEDGYMKHLGNFICSKFRNSSELYNLQCIHPATFTGSTDCLWQPDGPGLSSTFLNDFDWSIFWENWMDCVVWSVSDVESFLEFLIGMILNEMEWI